MGLLDNIIAAESGGNPDARNPNSSATGAGQFIDSTWLEMMAKHRPDLVAGKSPQEILALRSDPALSREMTGAYAADNAGVLASAGFQPSPGAVYLAHFAGPQGALKVMGADPSTPVSALLGDGVVKANPFLKGMSAADLQGWASKKVGDVPLQQTKPTAAPSINQPAPQTSYAPPKTIPAAAPTGSPAQQADYFSMLQPPQLGAPPDLRRKVDLTKIRTMISPVLSRAFS